MKATSIFKSLFLTFVLFIPLVSFTQGSSMSNPIIIGTYESGSFNFNDSKSNKGYGNNYADPGSLYRGQQSEDIFYRFTVKGAAEMSVSSCTSNFDTYLHLLKNDGTPLEHNDDDGPLCVGSRASIKTSVGAGTYFLVFEGYGTGSGLINISINIIVQAATIVLPEISIDNRNYTRVWEALVPGREVGEVLSKPVREVRQTTTYFDGLGRVEQVVAKQSSLALATGVASDLVSPVVYDVYGRQKDRYLPYAAAAADGLFKDNVLAMQYRFYRSAASPVAGQGEQYFFSRTEQEPLPLGRVTRTLPAGNSWVGAARGVSVSLEVNTAADSVRRWTVTGTTGAMASYHSDTTYAQGSLYRRVTTDEAGKKVVEYQDKQGKVVLKKVQESSTPALGHSGWLCTCYIYDDLERLRAVLQPAAVQAMNGQGDWTVDEATLSELAFRYEYDSRGRMMLKKVPGAAAVYLVYDRRDRLVMTQDANMRKPGNAKWLVTTYDALNRPVTTGLWSDEHDLAFHLVFAFDRDRYPDLSSGFELLTQTHYDDYNDLPAGLQNSLTGNYRAFLDASPTAPDYAQPLTPSTHTKGLVTWTTTRVLGQQQFLSTVSLYDDRGRVLQTQSEQYGGGTTIATLQYDFAGKVLRSHLEHHQPGGDVATTQLATKNSYDDLGRTSRIEKNIGNTGWNTTALMEYDALGSLQHKKLAPGYNNNQGLETIDYEYNIRGWLLGMNRSYLALKNSSGYNNRFFGFELGYDKVLTRAGTSFSQPQYNGNISGTLWKSSGDEVRRKYDFTYDAVNRFGKADFTQNTDAAADGSYTTAGANFSVHGFNRDGSNLMAYDANGNILSMVQHGIRAGAPDAVIDALHYTYLPHSNKLQQVLDDHNDNSSVLGDFKYDPATKTAVDYGYDKNGNLVTDRNKHLTGATGIDLEEGGAITYNYLNLPCSITVEGKGIIEYTYDAFGNKLAKSVHETGKPDHTTRYLPAGLVYDNDTLQFLSHEEGRIRPLRDTGHQVSGYVFDYFLKDHLGNVRMVLSDEQSQDAYPAASLEQASQDSEKKYYRIPESATVNKTTVPGYPQQDDYTTPNDYVQRLNGSAQKIGTSIVLKVMAGDRVNIRASSWYRQNGVATGRAPGTVADIVASLLQGIAGAPGGKIGLVTPEQQQLLASGVTSFISQQPASAPGNTKPNSYLNWLLLDEQLHPVITSDGSNSGFEPVGEDQQLTIHQVTERPLTKNGYLYIYLSNESPGTDVFFDNLQVTHIRGPLLEETHYYPFGLTMAGISTKAAGKMENRTQFNGIEHTTDLDLNQYDAFYRTLDPQIGRFLQIDPKIESAEAWSPYSAMLNNPIRYVDPLGDSTIPGAGFWRNALEGVKDGGTETVGFFKSLVTVQGWKNVGNGLLDLADRADTYSVTGAIKNAESVNALTNYVSNIPEMTKDQIGHDLGYGLEKTAEAVVATKGISIIRDVAAVANASKLESAIETLRKASEGSGNFSLGEASANASNKMGKMWVGNDAKLASDGRTLVSQDRLKQYRPPAAKKSPFATTGIQSNFQSRNIPKGYWINNGHLNITQKP